MKETEEFPYGENEMNLLGRGTDGGAMAVIVVYLPLRGSAGGGPKLDMGSGRCWRVKTVQTWELGRRQSRQFKAVAVVNIEEGYQWSVDGYNSPQGVK